MSARAKLQEVAVPPAPTFPEDQLPRILFQPLEYGEHEAWKYVHGHHALVLAKHAKAVASGTALLMQINRRDAFEAATNAPEPVFSDHHRELLEDLVWAAADMLSLRADELIADANRKQIKEREGSST